jgi:cytochrome c peroxidase
MLAGKQVAVAHSRGRRSAGRAALRAAVSSLAVVACLSVGIEAGSRAPNTIYSVDATGVLATYRADGEMDLSNPFFQSLGTNGRSCNTCHVAQDAWTVAPRHIQERFIRSRGKDPIFRPVDGAICPSANVSSLKAKVSAYSLLLKKGLFRMSMPVPAGAEFTITDIHDPYNCPETTATNPALYRRPLPATNLGFLSAVMWDGRETVAGSTGKSINLQQSLSNQAKDATLGHGQASAPPTPTQLAAIVTFEQASFTAQAADIQAGLLTGEGARGGPKDLSQQPFYIGINDALGGDPTGAKFDSNVFSIYNTWSDSDSAHRRSVARGQMLFNNYPINITGVAGLNDALGETSIPGTCSTCHDSPNAGDHSLAVALAIGTTAYPAPGLDIAGLPVYGVRCNDGTTKRVTDLGRAMITGKCADVGKLKGPILRGLAGRAPYFHNGGAATLKDVVEFYDQRFNMNLTDRQKVDLVAFLRTL